MPRFLNPRGRSTLGIGICDRCRKKMSLDDLRPDGDNPGLRVCSDCSDEPDPYRFAARPTENISLRFTRPDVKLRLEAIVEASAYNVVQVETAQTGDQFYPGSLGIIVTVEEKATPSDIFNRGATPVSISESFGAADGLAASTVSSFLLQENGDVLLQENGDAIVLDVPSGADVFVNETLAVSDSETAIGTFARSVAETAAAVDASAYLVPDSLLQENGDALLQENGDLILLESSDGALPDGALLDVNGDPLLDVNGDYLIGV